MGRSCQHYRIQVFAVVCLILTSSSFAAQSNFQSATTKTAIVSDVFQKPLNLNELVERLQESSIHRNTELADMPDDFWRFIPEFVGSIIPAKFPGILQQPREPGCWINQTRAHWGRNAVEFDLCFSSSRGTGGPQPTHTNYSEVLNCSDSYMLATTEKFHIFSSHGHSRCLNFTWELSSAYETLDVQENGIRLFAWRDTPVELAVDVFATLWLFLGALGGPSVPAETARSNLRFLEQHADFIMAEREEFSELPPETAISSGDMFCIMRLDGTDPMVVWGTGSPCGHTAMALHIDGELYVVESQLRSNYWPQDGVQRTKWRQWLEWARLADYNVAWLPLSKVAAGRFNASAAKEYFDSSEGQAYGLQTFIWGWLDTAQDNFPPPLDSHLVMCLFAILDPLLRALPLRPSSIWTSGMALRLGLDPCNEWSSEDLFRIAASRGLSFGELLEIREEDDWKYPVFAKHSEGAQRTQAQSRTAVCSAFVCSMWKSGGLFNRDLDIQCQEFTPLDVVELTFFDKQQELPKPCSQHGYCQLLGKYEISIPFLGSVEPFDAMREKCPSVAPHFTTRRNPITATSC